MIEWYCRPARFCRGLTWVVACIDNDRTISVSMWEGQKLFGSFRRLLRAIANDFARQNGKG